MRSRRLRLSGLCAVVILLGASGMTWGAKVLVDYSENFEWGETGIPLSVGAAGSDYWYSDTAGLYAGVSWGAPPYGYWTYCPLFSFDGNLYRDFRSAGTLGMSDYFSKATLQVYSKFMNGSDSDYSHVVRVWMLDPSQNGYMGSINRPGEMNIYRVDAGVLTPLAQKPEGEVPNGNAKVTSLSVINGVVTLKFYYDGDPGTVYSLAVADSAFSQFTTIGFGGAYGYGEQLGFDNVVLTQAIDYSQNFEIGEITVPASAGDVNSDYWYVDTGWLAAGVTWGGAPYGRWVYAPDSSFNGNMFRDFRAAGNLGASEYFANATLQVFSMNIWGADADPSLVNRVWLLDANQNGYMGSINRPGEMNLYRVDAGILIPLAQKPELEVLDGNAKVTTLSVVNGSVTLSFYYTSAPATVYTLTFADTTYSQFTTIGVGGAFGSGASLGFDNVKLTSKLAGTEVAAAEVVKTAVTPVIDGQADSIWASSNVYAADHISNGPENYTGPSDATVSFRVLWDTTAIYYLITVCDDVKSIGLPFTGNWNIDGLEIYTDANNSRGASYAADDFQTAINWGSTVAYNGSVPGMSAATVEIDGGYRLEVALPWSGLGLSMAPGIDHLFGMGLAYNDRDSGDTRQTQLMFATKGTMLWSQPCDFVTGKLVAARTGGDANCDGMVDVGDLGILAANYGGSNKTWAEGDFNGDGLVDVGDLGILAANYGSSVNRSVDFAADYAKAFRTEVEDDTKETASSICSGLGLPLIAGLMLVGLLLVKLEE